METRKVQQVGGGTYTVSLPADWADEHDVEAGAPIYLYTHLDGSLVARWHEKDQSVLAAVEIEVDGPEASTVRRLLRSAYVAGFERITLTRGEGFAEGQRQAVAALAHDLIGVEVDRESETEIRLQGLLDPGEVSVRQSVCQLRFVALSMHETALAALAGDATDAEHVLQRDDDADRTFHLVARHFNRSLTDFEELDQLGLTRRQLFATYYTARQLERVADHAVRVARVATRLDGEIDEGLRATVRSLGAESRRVVEEATDGILDTPSREKAHAALDRCGRVTEELYATDAALTDLPSTEAHVLTRVLDSLARTVGCGKNIAECAVRASLQRSDPDPENG